MLAKPGRSHHYVSIKKQHKNVQQKLAARRGRRPATILDNQRHLPVNWNTWKLASSHVTICNTELMEIKEREQDSPDHRPEDLSKQRTAQRHFNAERQEVEMQKGACASQGGHVSLVERHLPKDPYSQR